MTGEIFRLSWLGLKQTLSNIDIEDYAYDPLDYNTLQFKNHKVEIVLHEKCNRTSYSAHTNTLWINPKDIKNNLVLRSVIKNINIPTASIKKPLKKYEEAVGFYLYDIKTQKYVPGDNWSSNWNWIKNRQQQLKEQGIETYIQTIMPESVKTRKTYVLYFADEETYSRASRDFEYLKNILINSPIEGWIDEYDIETKESFEMFTTVLPF